MAFRKNINTIRVLSIGSPQTSSFSLKTKENKIIEKRAKGGYCDNTMSCKI
jgi:hypothetical protein